MTSRGVMNVADRVARANTLAAYLDGAGIDLADELNDRGWPELIADDEFMRLFSDRCWRCPDCGTWVVNDGQWAGGEPPCPDCDEDHYDYEGDE